MRGKRNLEENTQLLSEVSRSARMYPTLFSLRMQSISFRDAIVIFYKWSNVNSNFMKHYARVYDRGNGRETGVSPLHFFVTVRHLLDWSVLFDSILKNVMFQDRYATIKQDKIKDRTVFQFLIYASTILEQYVQFDPTNILIL